MTIQTIINRAVKRLELEGKLLTPDFYAEAFCKEVTKAKMNVEDCNHLDKYTKTLNKDFQKELRAYHIKTLHEFVRFVVAKLNRTHPTQCSDTLEAQNLLTKRILQVVEELGGQEAGDLSRNSIEIIDTGAQATQLNTLRQQWVNLLTTLPTSSPTAQSSGTSSHLDLEKISKLFISSFVPSIASSVNESIAALSDRIRNEPELLESESIEKEIRSTISLRIALDKDSVKEMIESIDGVLDTLSLRLIDMIEKSDNSTQEIQDIKKELETYSEPSSTNFKVTHKKLYTIAVALEQNTQLLSKDLKGHSNDVSALSKKIALLEKELASAKKESKEDFLTKLYNKRALDEFLEMKEAEFKRYDRNYSIIMFDIDFFKNVNDTYGHDAGDAVLSAFASILKKECRNVDIVGRFGGEEFLAILSETDTKGGVIFAQKVRQHVEKARFKFRGEVIAITVSSGVSERTKHLSLSATVNSADEYLYQAKNSGRNRVEYKK